MNMKKILLFALPLLAMCFTSCEKDNGNNGEELSGDDVIQFKDPNFLKALLTVQEISLYDAETDDWISYTMDVDSNGDGQITVNEAKAVRGLEISECRITNMEEIKYFTSIEYLGCYFNQIRNLTLDNHPNLVYLACGDNEGDIPFTTLNVSGCPALVELLCEGGNLTNLDLSHNVELRGLTCNDNDITSLDLSKNHKLQSFYPFGISGSGNGEIEFGGKCPLESLILYKNHSISEENMNYINLAYPDLKITYAE